jgi:hypothetical protein
VADAGEQTASRYIQVVQSAIDDGGILQRHDAPLNELFGWPLTARLEQVGRDLTEERLRVLPQSTPQIVGPGSIVG